MSPINRIMVEYVSLFYKPSIHNIRNFATHTDLLNTLLDFLINLLADKYIHKLSQYNTEPNLVS